MKICSHCGFSKHEKFFEKGRQICIKCRNERRRRKAKIKRDYSKDSPWTTADEITFIKKLSLSNAKAYYKAFELRENWAGMDKAKIKEFVESELQL